MFHARQILISFFCFDKYLPLSSCKLASRSSLHSRNLSASIKNIFMRQAPGISGKFWIFWWIINELVRNIQKLLLLLLSILNEFYAHASGARPRVKRTLSRASQLILAIDLKKRVDSSKFLHSTRVPFSRAIACSPVTSRNFLLNAIRNTESFLEGHLPLLNLELARRASNGAFLREIHKNKWILTRKVSIFDYEKESFPPRLLQNNLTRLCAYAQGDTRWQSRSPRNSKGWKILCFVAFYDSFMLRFV